MALTDEASARPDMTRQLTRGLRRYWHARGHANVTELTLSDGHRADIVALSPTGEIDIVEVKSGLADLAADQKWHSYRQFCDRLWFGVAADFPLDRLPADCGILIADGFGADAERPASRATLPTARRKQMLIRIATLAARRLQGVDDPELDLEDGIGGL